MAINIILGDENNAYLDAEEIAFNVIPKGRPIIYHIFRTKDTVLLSLDIETAGEWVGIFQLLAEICCLDLVGGDKK